MRAADDHRWNLSEGDAGNVPECDEAYQRKIAEWQARDWSHWLAKHLTFPITVTREEDDDDAYFSRSAAKAPFRLGHKMEVVELAEEDVDLGMMVKVRENRQIGYVPLSDVKVTSKMDANFWPIREYVVWFANRH